MFPSHTSASLHFSDPSKAPLPTTMLLPSIQSSTATRPMASVASEPVSRFNSKQFLVDLFSASVAGFAVSPIVTAVDQAIAESATGSISLIGSFNRSMRAIFKTPIQFMNNGAFKWVFLIYFATYATANITKTICVNRQVENAVFTAWASTSVVNAAACINKDIQFAKLFGGSMRPVPPTSFSIWAFRDCLSMFAFFTLPPMVATLVQEKTGNETLSKYSAQFFVPLVFQYVLTPIHRLGYDLYNNPGNNRHQVLAFLKKDFFLSAHLRMVRCFPPWVLGVTANAELRTKLGNAFGTTEQV